MTRHLLILVAAVGALAVLGSPALTSAATPSSARVSKSAKKYLKVFRHQKARRDTIRLKSGSKRAKARLAAADSRLVASTSDFKVYLVQTGSELCIWLIEPTTAGSGCGDVAALRSLRPPVMFKIGDTQVITVIPMIDGVATATRTDEAGPSRQQAVQNNVFVDVSAGGGQVQWAGPAGAVTVNVPTAGSL